MSPKNINITLLALLATFLPIIATSNETTITTKSNTIINSTCASTLYPDLCIASLTSSSNTSSTSNITSPMDVVMVSLNHTISTIHYNKIIINKIAGNEQLTTREKAALQDCNDTADDSLYELQKVRINLQNYPSKNSSADDLLTLLSAVLTNQETCIDGFSHDDDDRLTRAGFIAKQMHAYRLCSNILAMVKNMTNSSREDENDDEIESNNNNLGYESYEWITGGHRKLLRSVMVIPDGIVAAEGNGIYMTVKESMDAPAWSYVEI